MKCANPDCGREFEPYHKSTQKYCCRRCREKMEYRAAVADGRVALQNAKRREKRRARMAIQPKCVVRRSAAKGLSAVRCREIELEMGLPREELMKRSARWTAKERKYAQNFWEKKHGLFRCYPEEA